MNQAKAGCEAHPHPKPSRYGFENFVRLMTEIEAKLTKVNRGMRTDRIVALVVVLGVVLWGFPAAARDIQALIAQLKDAQPNVRAKAAQSLGTMGPAAIPAGPDLIKAMGDRDRIVQKEASAALKNIGPKAVPLLTQALRNKDPNIREGAALALGKMGTDAIPAIPELIQALGDREPSVRNASEFALRRIGDPAVPELRKALKNPQNDISSGARKVLVRMEIIPE